jgi:hypothetical protein
MVYVNHTAWGKGLVVKREILEKDGRYVEVSEGGNYLTVRFDDGRVSKFAIPASFERGVLTAAGELKNEVDNAIAVARELEKKKKIDSMAGIKEDACMLGRRCLGRRTSRVSSPSLASGGAIEELYESYLIDQGYRTETPGGHDSTVYSYIKAIKNHVLEEEGISWDTLKTEIAMIIPLYDKGGAKELIGSKSNNTVICALKCFEKLVDGNP